ncbi:hypothetical protein [Ekhidna sp.]|jgi:hypothetical protein|uniref:hypothetical protein n=1 Tax=Ekhidna sp. TaxID=2608089 RepID=UPI0032ED4579
MKLLTSILFMIVIGSCVSDDGNDQSSGVIIKESIYAQTETDNYTITEASIEGDILNVTIQSSGCDGSLWEAKLVDSGAIAESYPVQRFAKVSLTNTEMCDAIVTRSFTFDITPLRVEDQLYLNLEGWDGQLHYDF